MRAFWNKFHLGCNEHLLVHKIRNCDAYVPQISRVAEFGGKFIEPKVFEDLSEEENEEFTKNFSTPVKQKFPCQWD